MCKRPLSGQENRLYDLKEGLKDCFTYGRQPFADYLLEKSAPVKIGTELGMQFTTEGVFQGQFCVHSLGEIGSLNALAALALLICSVWMFTSGARSPSTSYYGTHGMDIPNR